MLPKNGRKNAPRLCEGAGILTVFWVDLSYLPIKNGLLKCILFAEGCVGVRHFRPSSLF